MRLPVVFAAAVSAIGLSAAAQAAPDLQIKNSPDGSVRIEEAPPAAAMSPEELRELDAQYAPKFDPTFASNREILDLHTQTIGDIASRFDRGEISGPEAEELSRGAFRETFDFLKARSPGNPRPDFDSISWLGFKDGEIAVCPDDGKRYCPAVRPDYVTEALAEIGPASTAAANMGIPKP